MTCPVEAKLLHAQRQADMKMLIVAFQNFPNMPKNAKNNSFLCVSFRHNPTHDTFHIN